MARCPKCSGQMEEGFVLDRTHGAQLQELWVEGPPTKSFWSGVTTKNREQIPVTTFRCSKCGYLESFASSA
jgi:predicted nucleic-acid-binding Zn-ribbon protein